MIGEVLKNEIGSGRAFFSLDYETGWIKVFDHAELELLGLPLPFPDDEYQTRKNEQRHQDNDREQSVLASYQTCDFFDVGDAFAMFQGVSFHTAIVFAERRSLNGIFEEVARILAGQA